MNTTETAETAIVLKDAADLIDQHGWAQEYFGDLETGMCALGAIRTAVASRWLMGVGTRCVTARLVFNEWLRGMDPDFSSIPKWNDASGRTKEEVILHLRKCADELGSVDAP